MKRVQTVAAVEDCFKYIIILKINEHHVRKTDTVDAKRKEKNNIA